MMAIKIFFMTAVLAALVFAVHCAPSERSELNQQRPDVLFIANPDTHPVILSPQEAMANQITRGCSNSGCSYACHTLGYRYGRCNTKGDCICSHFP